MLSIDVWAFENLRDGLLVSLLMRLIEACKLQFEIRAWYRKDLRHRRALRQHAGKIRLGPDCGEIDAAVVEQICIHQSRDQAKRKIVAVDGMRCKQRPSAFEFDGPEAVELDRGLFTA